MANLPKYYVYISDTKIDMIYSQIPQRKLEEISGELKIDLKLFSATVKKSSGTQNRYTKVDIVSHYLLKHAKVGSINEPQTYFTGTIPMRWGLLGDNLAYFAGSQANTILGLGGSIFHVVGEKRELEIPIEGYWSASSAMAIINQLNKITLEEDITGVSDFNLHLIEGATKELKGPLQKYEFLARSLIQRFDESRQLHLLLGSPIYIALLD
jgi:hypothetical protein